MTLIGEINDRVVLYQKHSLETNWEKELPTSDWLLLCITEVEDSNILNEIARKIIDKNVCFVCCIGTHGEKLHDIIDENVGIRECEIEDNYLPKHTIMTTWDDRLDEGFWFSIFSAHNNSVIIKKIFCLDLGLDTHKDDLITLIKKFNDGFIPDN